MASLNNAISIYRYCCLLGVGAMSGGEGRIWRGGSERTENAKERRSATNGGRTFYRMIYLQLAYPVQTSQRRCRSTDAIINTTQEWA